MHSSLYLWIGASKGLLPAKKFASTNPHFCADWISGRSLGRGALNWFSGCSVPAYPIFPIFWSQTYHHHSQPASWTAIRTKATGLGLEERQSSCFTKEDEEDESDTSGVWEKKNEGGQDVCAHECNLIKGSPKTHWAESRGNGWMTKDVNDKFKEQEDGCQSEDTHMKHIGVWMKRHLGWRRRWSEWDVAGAEQQAQQQYPHQHWEW